MNAESITRDEGWCSTERVDHPIETESPSTNAIDAAEDILGGTAREDCD